jgi:hypothetical protein
MGQEIAIQTHGSTALASVTPFSLTSLLATVPDWLGRDLFENGPFSLPAQIPADGPRQLRDVAQRFRDSLGERAVREMVGQRPVEKDGETSMVPIISDPLDQILGELRLRTIPRNEGDEESKARFRILRDDCRPHCLEAVREASMAYAKKHKFFPAGIGELLPFIRAAEGQRERTMNRLLDAARRAEEELAERKRVADDPVDPDEVSALLSELSAASGRKVNQGVKKDYSNLRMPTAEELAALAAEPKGRR